MMRAHHWLLVILAIAGLAAGYLMLPQPQERAAILKRDGNQTAAIAELRALYDGGNREPQIMQQLAEMYEDNGDITNALIMLRAFSAIRPNNIYGWQRLAALYDATGNRPAMTETLARIFELQPTESEFYRLLRIYNLDGRFDEERDLIMRHRDASYIKPEDIERVASLLLARGMINPAIELLLAADRKATPDHQSSRLLLFDAFLIDQRYDDATAAAVRWLPSWPRWLTIHLVVRLGRVAPPDQTAAFVIAVTEGQNRKQQEVCTALTLAGHRDAVANMIDRLLARAPDPTSAQVEHYVTLALDAGAHRTVMRAFVRALRGGMVARGQARFARAIFNNFGANSLAPFQLLRRHELLVHEPVFAADLALALGNELLAQHYLKRTDLSRLSRADRRQWLNTANSVWPPHIVLRSLDKLHRETRLTGDLAKAYLALNFRLGRHREHREMLLTMARQAR